MKRVLAFVLLAAISCRHGDDGTAAASGGGALAVAGDDFKVALGATAALDGSKSAPAGEITYRWEQIAGETVALSDPTVAQPTFTAPGSEGTLTFRLTVASAAGTGSDTVVVTVKTVVVDAPDAWFVGYNVTGSITATASGGTGIYTYQWTWPNGYSWFTWTDPSSPTVGYATPPLLSLQNFWDQQYIIADVAVLHNNAQGRVQLKVKATDGDGIFDEELVNFSAGPFASAVMGRNAGLGEPVFLTGGWNHLFPDGFKWVASRTWSGTKPDGDPIAFFRENRTPLPDGEEQLLVYFVPDMVGRYQILVTQTMQFGEIGYEVINVDCGTYVGVGGRLGAPADLSKGECAACHGGQIGRDIVGEWSRTAHATAFSRLIDPSDSSYAASQAKGSWRSAFDFGSDFSIDARTTGFSLPAAASNGSWADRASTEGYRFQGTSWSTLQGRYPGTAALSDVQCEGCHGPGSRHAGDTSGIAVSPKSTLCGRCHASQKALWDRSRHVNNWVNQIGGSPHCSGCHSVRGFAIEMRAQEGSDVTRVLTAEVNPARPIIRDRDRGDVGCALCHEPHRKTLNRDEAGRDPQLRVYGRVKFRNDMIVDAGPAAACYICHQSQLDPRDGSPDFNARRVMHDGPAAEIISGTGGMHFDGWVYNNSPHAMPDRFIVPGATRNRYCLTCHYDEGDTTPGSERGGHIFLTDWPNHNYAACLQCHDSMPTDFNVDARGDYDGNGSRETIREEMWGLEDRLRNAIGAALGTLGFGPWYTRDRDANGLEYAYYWNGAGYLKYPGPAVPASESGFEWDSLPLLARIRWTNIYKATYNAIVEWDEHSAGLHNTGYQVNLLQSSIKALDPTATFEPFVPLP